MMNQTHQSASGEELTTPRVVTSSRPRKGITITDSYMYKSRVTIQYDWNVQIWHGTICYVNTISFFSRATACNASHILAIVEASVRLSVCHTLLLFQHNAS